MVARSARSRKVSNRITSATLLTKLDSLGYRTKCRWEIFSCLSDEVIEAGFRGDCLPVAWIAFEIAADCQPITLRGLFYRLVSAGVFPSTDKEHYNKVGRIVSRLRRCGIMPFRWIVDSLRTTHKPSSWSGLGDFCETLRGSYRLDFWRSLDDYCHVICEKDAIAGTIAPITEGYDVSLSPIRGYCSDSFAHAIGSQWAEIEKPISCFYLGDHDPSGIDLERDVRRKLEQHSGKSFSWVRLAINPADFEEFDLIRLEPKKSDRRYRKFREQYGDACAEVDALHPNELRQRIAQAIEKLIPQDRWRRLQLVEQAERETFESTLGRFMAGGAA